MDLFGYTDNGAVFSDDRMYRYALWRIWDKDKPLVMFIGLNPSTAAETTDSDDPTITRVKNFAHDWGYGGVYMMNVFAYVTAYPKELKKADDPVGENDGWLEKIAAKCEKVVFAWGNFKEAQERGQQLANTFDGWALHINQNGSPKHPLYVSGDVELVKYQLGDGGKD